MSTDSDLDNTLNERSFQKLTLTNLVQLVLPDEDNYVSKLHQPWTISPLVTSSTVHAIANSRFYLIPFIGSFVMGFSIYFGAPNPVCIVAALLVTFVVICEGTRFDRTLLKLVLTEFNFWVLMFCFHECMLAFALVEYRLHNVPIRDILGDYVAWLTSITMSALDAAPLYPKKFKVLAVLFLLFLYTYWLFYFAIMYQYDAAWDQPICAHSQCLSPRTMQISGMTTAVLYLLKMLYQLLRSRPYMMLIQIPVSFKVTETYPDY